MNPKPANKKFSLLFVDDEKRILTSLRSIFRKEYQVFVANSGAEALELLDKNAIDVVISDQRMPGMLGNELLTKIHKKYPKIMRLLLTGFVDKDAIINTINEGEIYRFINKPWNNDDIKKVVREAAEASRFDVLTVGDAVKQVFNKQSVLEYLAKNNPDQGVVVLGSNQSLRNQVRTFCRKHSLNIYGALSVPQVLGIVSAKPTIGVAIIELPLNSDEAILTINVLKEKRPELITIVLTDETDADTAIELINSGQVFRYLTKPIETNELTVAIEQAFNRHAVINSQSDLKSRYKVEKTKRTITDSLKDIFSSFTRLKRHI